MVKKKIDWREIVFWILLTIAFGLWVFSFLGGAK